MLVHRSKFYHLEPDFLRQFFVFGRQDRGEAHAIVVAQRVTKHVGVELRAGDRIKP